VGDAVHAEVEAALSGDERAFATLHRRYARMVHAILLSRVRPADVEDLVQEVFLIAWRKLDQLDDARVFGAWLGTIARNRAADHHRRAHVTESLDGFDVGGGPSPGDRVEAHRVLATIQALPEAYRETLVMRLVEGMNGPEIAAVTGLEEGSVRINLHRGMKLLREKLGVEQKVAVHE
jgi:RNA polymerase sigma-70 factor (ECF subfamily)